MRTIIIGGGKVGYNLFKTLKEKNYDAIIIERDKNTCIKLAEDISADVIWGDGTNLDVKGFKYCGCRNCSSSYRNR